VTKTIVRFPSFTTQAVRDLAWACFAPALIQTSRLNLEAHVTDCHFQLDTQRLDWLEALDRDPTPLLAHVKKRTGHRLGLYFEALWHFFLEQDERCDLLANNLPVHDGARTIGEFDCIYRCLDSDRTVHLELAVKYFLRSPLASSDDSGHHNWLGPDVKDRLDLKIDHLMERQTRLADSAAAKAMLESLGIAVTDREIALRGYLFSPSPDLAPPRAFNSTLRLQRWLRRSDWRATQFEEDTMQFLALHKMRWLSAVVAGSQEATLSADELAVDLDAHFETETYPVMVAALNSQGLETERFFVTTDDWPALRDDTRPSHT